MSTELTGSLLFQSLYKRKHKGGRRKGFGGVMHRQLKHLENKANVHKRAWRFQTVVP